MWKVATFKNFKESTTDREREALISYAMSLSRVLLSASEDQATPKLPATSLRALLLKRQEAVDLQGLLAIAWALGIPVVQLGVFPLKAKRMCAMAVKVRERFAILLARESKYPAQVAYYVAHELGHIMLGHLDDTATLVDVDDPLTGGAGGDEQEVAADAFALEVLTGETNPQFVTEQTRFTGASLAKAASEAGHVLKIDAGTVVLCFGHGTGHWEKAMAALNYIYPNASLVGPHLNQVALSQLEAAGLSSENEDFVRAAMDGEVG